MPLAVQCTMPLFGVVATATATHKSDHADAYLSLHRSEWCANKLLGVQGARRI